MRRLQKLAQLEAERQQQRDYAAQNSLDAQRYLKLRKAFEIMCRPDWEQLLSRMELMGIDSAIDALPEAK